MDETENINLRAVYNTAKKNGSVYVYEAGSQDCMPDKPMRTHVFENTTLHFIVSGGGYFDGQRLGPGEGFMVMENETAIYKVVPEDPWTYYWINFSGNMVPGLIDRIGLSGTKAIFSFSRVDKIVNLFEEIFAQTFEDNEKDLWLTGRLFEILSVLGIDNSRYDRERCMSKTDEHYQNALRFIAANYCKDINVTDVAAHDDLEPHYLDRIFKMYSSVTPQQQILRLRMSRSSVLLRSTDQSVTKIAASVGYEDVLHFSKVFKNYFGVPPTVFRMNFLKDNS